MLPGKKHFSDVITVPNQLTLGGRAAGWAQSNHRGLGRGVFPGGGRREAAAEGSDPSVKRI